MPSWLPDDAFVPEDPNPNDDDSENGETPVAFVATQEPIPVRITEVPDDRTPDGMVCMGTFLEGKAHLIARSAVTPSMLSDLEESGAFATPVRLALAAVEQDPGLQCRLFALLPAQHFREADAEPAEPWAQSVPQFEDPSEPNVPENAVVPILLGHIIRFSRDRKHPEDLAQEAGDVLRTILAEEPSSNEVVDKLLEDLLGETDDPKP